MLVSNIQTVKADEPDNALNNYFPDISKETQAWIYQNVQTLIKKEEENELEQFHESLIDPELIRNFSKSIKVPQEHVIFSIDFGGSSLKITPVKISFCEENLLKPVFESLESFNCVYKDWLEKENKEKNENNKIINMKWYEWTVKRISEYLANNSTIELDPNVPHYAAFTFSSTLKQESLDSATVKDFNKPFLFADKKSLNGSNVVEDLNNELKDQRINIIVNCVLNDVVATYVTGVASQLVNPIALIIGTGTNAGFSISAKKGEKIINSEMAQFSIPETCLDKATKSIIEAPNNTFHRLEVTIAGMKFAEIVEAATKELWKQEQIMDLPANFYVDCIKKCLDMKPLYSPIEKLINKIVRRIRRRAYKLVSPIIYAASKNLPFSVIVNGTIACSALDNAIFQEELKKYLPKGKNTLPEIILNNEASLFGSAYVSLVYSTLKKKENLLN